MSQGITNVKLSRDGSATSWGFRLHGGKDIGRPFEIQRVFLGSPSERELQRGDTILQINEIDVAEMTHVEAHDLIKCSGNELRLLIHRLPGASRTPSSPLSPATKANTAHPLAAATSPPIAKATSFQPFVPGKKSPVPSHVDGPRGWSPSASPTPAQNIKRAIDGQTRPQSGSVSPQRNLYENAGHTSRSLPVATSPVQNSPQLTNLQYNSPLDLYSKESLREALQQQAALQPKSESRSPLPELRTKFSPALHQSSPLSPSSPVPALSPAKPGTKLGNIVDITLSPTFQMIQESENRVASPRPESKTPPPVSKSPPRPGFYTGTSTGYGDPTINAFGVPKDTIHQSGSFKTLMATLGHQSN